MHTHRLTQTDARQIAVRAQLLDADRPDQLLRVAEHLTAIQLDPTSAVAPSAELVAWSRLGAWIAIDAVTAALTDRTLFDLDNFARPATDLPLFTAAMAAWPGPEPLKGWQRASRDWVTANDACRRDVLAALATGGPQVIGELPDTCAIPWRSSGWNNNRNVGRLVEMMARRGEVAVAGRRGREKLWDLAGNVYPDLPPVPLEQAQHRLAERRLTALGLARAKTVETPIEPNGVGPVGEPAVIEGVRGQWRVDPTQLDRPFIGRTALLSPLDRLVFDRKRMTEIFAFDYQLEMYKPALQRRWGYYALPVLVGDQLVGKVDATADRAAGVLRVAALHRDPLYPDDAEDSVRAELDSVAEWLGLGLELPAD